MYRLWYKSIMRNDSNKQIGNDLRLPSKEEIRFVFNKIKTSKYKYSVKKIETINSFVSNSTSGGKDGIMVRDFKRDKQ